MNTVCPPQQLRLPYDHTTTIGGCSGGVQKEEEEEPSTCLLQRG
jgi:hypothetical protein